MLYNRPIRRQLRVGMRLECARRTPDPPRRFRRRTGLRTAHEGSRDESNPPVDHDRNSRRRHSPRHAQNADGRSRWLIDTIGPAVDSALLAGDMFWLGHAFTVLVEALVHRGTDADLHAAQSAIDRLQAIPVETTFVLHEVQLLRMRALMAQAHGDDTGYRSYVDRYRTRADGVPLTPAIWRSPRRCNALVKAGTYLSLSSGPNTRVVDYACRARRSRRWFVAMRNQPQNDLERKSHALDQPTHRPALRRSARQRSPTASVQTRNRSRVESKGRVAKRRSR